MSRQLLCAALTALLATPVAFAADPVNLTIYHADNDALFTGAMREASTGGHALVLEHRAVALTAGTHVLQVNDLPHLTNAETLSAAFTPAAGVTVIGQQLSVAHPLADAVGGPVEIFTDPPVGGADARPLRGTLLGWATDAGALVGTADGKLHFIRRYASMTLPSGSVVDSSTLRLTLDAKASGPREVRLTYMTGGLGWRAAYAATLANGDRCRMQLKPEASIANRSGRNYADARVTLIAGQPNLARATRRYGVAVPAGAPAPMAAAAMPAQAQLDDYRSFTLPGRLDLRKGSVTLAPLYRAQTLACQRAYVVEDGNAYFPTRPNTNDYGAQDYQDHPVPSTLAFTAPEALPAGTLRAWMADQDGAPQLLGEGDVNDTPKGQRVAVQLGQSFELRVSRERTAFHVDAKGHTLAEAYAITVTNGGESARTVTLREHPNRWREWTLTESSRKPSRQTPQLLEFEVPVPANGKATLTYAIRYTWTAQDL